MSIGKLRTKKVKIAKKSPVKKQVRLSSTVTSKSEVLATPTAKPTTAKLTTRSLTLTKPVSPTLRANKRLSTASKSQSALSTEDIKIKKIEQEKKVEQLKIQKAKRLYQKLKSNGFQSTAKAPVVPMKKATIPKSPKSILDKKHGTKVPSNLKKSPVKQSTKKSTKLSLQPTIPEPFNFATDTRVKSSLSSTGSSLGGDNKLGNSLTAGEMAEKFMRDPRSHYVPETANKQLTRPHSPKLQTEIRSKSAKRDRPLSREEMEEKFMEIQHKNSFKARTLDRRIFDSRGELGVPKVPVKALTIPMDIELRTEKRASSPRAPRPVEVPEEEHFEFKARPIPSTLKHAEKMSTPPSKAHFKPTIAQSPKLHCLERASAAPARRQRPHHTIVEQEKKIAESVRKSTGPLKLTQPKEFNLETSTRGEFHKAHLEELLERERKEVMTAFKAQPMPDLHKAFHPKIEHKDPTIPQPFQLQSVQLHEESLEEFAREVQEERKKVTSSTFKAKSVPKTLYEAKQTPVNVENKAHPTIPLSVNLESEVRAKKRQEFEDNVQKKKHEDDLVKQDLMKQKEDEENRALKNLRRKSVQEGGLMFKAAPILKEDLYPVKSSPRAKQPTIPKSPAFKLKERRQTQQSKLETPMTEKETKTLRMAAAMRTL